jgi:hypothetical protein
MKMRIAMLAAAAAALAVSAAAPASAGHCVMAGGTADMVTLDLAKFMANAALNNSIKAHGWKASGPVNMKCSEGVPYNCTAKQKACS